MPMILVDVTIVSETCLMEHSSDMGVVSFYAEVTTNVMYYISDRNTVKSY